VAHPVAVNPDWITQKKEIVQALGFAKFILSIAIIEECR
jgi:hypothetical protein